MKNKDFLLFAGVVIGIIAIASVLSFATGKITGNVLLLPEGSTPIDCTDSDSGKIGNSLLTNGSIIYSYINSTSGPVENSKEKDICSSYYGLTEYYCTYDKKPAYIQRNCNKNFLTDKRICFEGECRTKSNCTIYKLDLKVNDGSSANVTLFTPDTPHYVNIDLASVRDYPSYSYKMAMIKVTRDGKGYGYSQHGSGTFFLIAKSGDYPSVVPVPLMPYPYNEQYFLNLQLTSIDTTAQTAKIRATTCRPDY